MLHWLLHVSNTYNILLKQVYKASYILPSQCSPCTLFLYSLWHTLPQLQNGYYCINRDWIETISRVRNDNINCGV